MFHPTKFAAGTAQNQRLALLRDLTEIVRGMPASAGVRLFRRADQVGRRGMYVLAVGKAEYGLEKSQVELAVFGMTLALLASGAPVPHERLHELLARVCTRLPDGVYPGPWLHEPRPEAAPDKPPRTPRRRKSPA